jgi:hypothetical protein
MNKKLELELHILENRIAHVSIGDTAETDNLRIHRYRPSVFVWDLTNAGKRGKQVDRFSVDFDRGKDDTVENASYDLVDAIHKSGSYAEALALAKKFCEQHGITLHEGKERGVDVAPGGFKPISVKGKECWVTADYDSFTVRDHSDINEETCIPAVKGGKADIKVFYRWLKDNEEQVKSMSFNDVARAMSDAGIRYHRYCALD